MSRSRRMPPLFEVMRETNPPRGPLPPPTPVNIPRPAGPSSGAPAAPVVRPITPAAAPAAAPTPATPAAPRRDAGGPALALRQPEDDAPAAPEAVAEAKPSFTPGAWDFNRQLTIPVRTIFFGIGGLILVLFLVWGLAWKLGHESALQKYVVKEANTELDKSDPLADAAVAPDPLTSRTAAATTPSNRAERVQPPPQQPAARSGPPQPAVSVPVPAGSLAPGADPRGTGLNYLWILTLPDLDAAETVAAFLTRNGVPASVVPTGKVDMATARANNHRGWEVFALEGIPSGQYRARAAQREALQKKVESLETALNRELKSPVRLNAHQWKKY